MSISRRTWRARRCPRHLLVELLHLNGAEGPAPSSRKLNATVHSNWRTKPILPRAGGEMSEGLQSALRRAPVCHTHGHMADYDYDLFVIGAGSGGVRASRIAGAYG